VGSEAVLPLPPGSTLGIIGGGQLGRMLAMAAARLGLATAVLDPDRYCPAAQVAGQVFCAAYDDEAALGAFAGLCDRVTYEFENVPVETVDLVGAKSTVLPARNALQISQDRLVEKRFLESLGIETAPFEPVGDIASLAEAAARIGPCLLKTRRLGYDGKGQLRIGDATSISADAGRLLAQPCIVEGLIDFRLEVSVVAVRGAAGDFLAYDPAWNRHENGILRSSRVPAPVGDDVTGSAIEAARLIAESLDYVGVVGVEFFVCADNRLLVNEFAPRVHNSGHWTEAACVISQFENHVRAVSGWKPGTTRRHSDCEMHNLIGAEIEGVEKWLGEPDCLVQVYGKKEIRDGRKMGHVTRIRPIAPKAI
jgi:5-(carboxyamino)imidazole ribonucleotide synthase